ncbi:MAG TPA: hypothetical protein VLK33_15450 [Terriglobales bacterium]|nr:hypothetical protein [Terriglobales bacterium]
MSNLPPPRHMTSLAVDPSDAEAVAGETAPFDAIGTFDQTPTTVDSLPAQWSSEDTTIVTVDPNGIATCVMAGGPIMITASVAANGNTLHSTSKLTCTAVTPPQTGNGHCVYKLVGGSTRVGPTLTGYCAGERDNACHVSLSSACLIGHEATATGQSTCSNSVDLGRTCNP